MLDSETRAAIRHAFSEGLLKVQAVDPASGRVGLHTIADVLRHNTPHKGMVRLVLEGGREATFTVDHSVFYLSGSGILEAPAGKVVVGQELAVVDHGVLLGARVLAVETCLSRLHTYDLSVPGPQNFVLANGTVAHNSYSVGGISLDLDRSGKYESLKGTADQMFDKAVESKKETVKVIRGLKQPRFAGGLSRLGPHVGAGIGGHPRAFMGAF